MTDVLILLFVANSGKKVLDKSNLLSYGSPRKFAALYRLTKEEEW